MKLVQFMYKDALKKIGQCVVFELGQIGVDSVWFSDSVKFINYEVSSIHL